MTPFRKLKIFHRIAVHGVLLLICIAVFAIVAFHVVEDRSGPHNAFFRTAELIRRTIEATNGSGEAVASALMPFHYISDSPIAVFTKTGDTVASLGAPPIRPLTAEEFRKLSSGGGPYHRRFAEAAFPVNLPSGPGALVITWRQAEKMRWRFALVIFLALVVIALMSIPVARSIAKPVKAITEIAEKLRDGDLKARVTVDSNDELALLAHTLNDMAEGLDHRIRREKELLANVSHELRTPLARIRVALEIAHETENVPPAASVQLDEIGVDIQELDQLVGDVLFSTKLDFSDGGDPASFALKQEETPLAPFLEETAARFEAETGRRVHRDIEGDSPVANIDTALFRRVIDNLLENSRKYSGNNTEIELTLQATDSKTIITVKDRGMGVSDDNLDRLFEPFFRTDKSRSRNAGGMGLGLTLAKRIVDAHGGRIHARSRAAGGLVVAIELPPVPPAQDSTV